MTFPLRTRDEGIVSLAPVRDRQTESEVRVRALSTFGKHDNAVLVRRSATVRWVCDREEPVRPSIDRNTLGDRVDGSVHIRAPAVQLVPVGVVFGTIGSCERFSTVSSNTIGMGLSQTFLFVGLVDVDRCCIESILHDLLCPSALVAVR